MAPAPDPEWPFDQARNAAALTCRSILEGAPILHVSHDVEDGGWQFLDGNDADEDQARVIGMGTAVGLDASLLQVADLPVGWVAWRQAVGEPWRREPHDR
ncbi:MAG TPA: hypothetical protein VHR16_01215 [Candidatus Limnocylindrales bacterium]|nr:hypothetical protein [Candidatus Limnocylindrales bacterium]